MLAIKECLIREGVLNLDSPRHVSSQRHFQLQSSKSSGNMDIMPRYRKTIAASSDLSTASATAKTSCQQQQPQSQQKQQQQPQPSDESVGTESKASYRGQHPHFHHHTTPAYYTDLQLRIHTPNASDVGALNENYQSVYSTPSTQLVEQRSFPKSSTATVGPQRSAFFRLGDTVSTDSSNNTRRQLRSSKERCAKSLPPSVSPTKGEQQQPQQQQQSNSSPRSHSKSPSIAVVEPASQVVVVSIPVATTNSNNNSNSSGRSSRHTQRFQQRSKRAVRVRSESRPISALYDIICKEKGLDVGDTTTTSNSNSSNDEEQQPEKQQQQPQLERPTQQQQQKSNTLATFWPLHHQYHRAAMSGAKQQQQQQPSTEQLDKQQHQQLTKQKRIHKHTNDHDDDGTSDDDEPYALHSSHKVTDLSCIKANSLPPTDYLKQQQQTTTAAATGAGAAAQQPSQIMETRLRSAKSLEPVAKKRQQVLLSQSDMMPVNTERMFVEPPKMSLPELKSCLDKSKEEAQESKEHQQQPEELFDQGEVLDTLARWQQELSSTIDKSAQILNGHHHHQHHHQDHYHHSASPTFDHHQPPVAVEIHSPALESIQAQPRSNHQATNARRFITRTPRSASRQSAGHSSPPPPAAGYHSDSSYSSPSPTRRQQQLATGVAGVTTGAAATGSSGAADPQSSTNGNSSAYETAATSVMTHAKPVPEQLHSSQEVEVPKATTPSQSQSQTNATSNVIIRPAAINSANHIKAAGGSVNKCSINCAYTSNNNNNSHSHSCSSSNTNSYSNNSRFSRFSRSNNNSHATPMPPNSSKAPLIVLKPGTTAAATTVASATTSTAAAASPSPSKRRKNLLSPLRIGSAVGGNYTPPGATPPQASPLLSSSSSSPQTSPAVRTTKASRLRAAALDRKKEEEHHQQQRQRYSSPSSLRTSSTPPTRRLSSSELSPKSNGSGFNSEPSGSSSRQTAATRSASQPAESGAEGRRPLLLANANNVSMKQNLSELHFTGGILSPAKVECTLHMRPRSSTLCADAEKNGLGSSAAGKARDHLANLQLSPVQKHKRTPEASPLPRRAGDRDKSAKRKSNLNRSYNEEATKDGDEASSIRRRRRRELGMARPLMPGDDESLRELLLSPHKSSCSESTSKSESVHQAARGINQKFNERTKTELAEIKKIAEQAQAVGSDEQQPPELKMSPILRRKSTDDVTAAATATAAAATQNSPPAPNQIVSILKKKEHAFGECNSSASSNASPVTFSANVLDTPLAGSRSKRQGILKKRSSLDESRYYSRSHSPDERSILIKSARRNSLEEAGCSLSPAQAHGILKQSSYDSSKSDGCPSANECQPHSILKKKDSLSTPSDGGGHVSKHVSISQAVTLAAAELAAHDDIVGLEDGEEHEGIRPILKQESTSSEEAARPPKPILKKKSFGEADEHEIRPILKSSRKSSREEFDLTGLRPDANDTLASDAMRPILKTDSPSKRRTLGSAQRSEEENANSLLKRRTRSLERQDTAPVIDLAAALDAITISQAPSTPVDFVATASSISVADRIKHMEMLSTPTSRTAGGINSSWESPLQQTPSSLHDSSAAPKLLKPSVLRRDLYRDRYKTQPVTNEEKSFFKANSTPFDISATSAFKPTKPLEIRNGSKQQQQQQQQQPLISPITGQPLSHVPAPLLLSSSTLSGAGASFRLARSSTQPLQSPRVAHLAAQGGGTPPTSVSVSSNNNSLSRQHSVNDSVSLGEQLTLSVGNDSERIFEMSGLDDDSAIQSLGDDASTNTRSSGATATTTGAAAGGSGVGVARSSSVRARANMFQQLQQQEQTRSRRETAGGEQLPTQSRSFANRQATSRHSPPPSASSANVTASLGSPSNEEPSTPNTTQDTTDADFEPSSLSLAERLAFFSSLCEGNGGSTTPTSSMPHHVAHPRFASRANSYASRSSPPYNSIDRSSNSPSNHSNHSMANSISSASVTPTPMECTPTTQEEEEQQQQQSLTEQHNGFVQLTRSATAPPTAATATTAVTTSTIVTPLTESTSLTAPRRIKLRTVGKLVMPDTFLSDRKHNNHRNSCLGRLQTMEDIHISMGVRTIGKIKSPFIEQQQQKELRKQQSMQAMEQQSNGNGHSLSDSGDDAHSSDSGKENCAANQQQQQQQQLETQQQPQSQQQQSQQVQELKRKLTHFSQITVQQKKPQATAVNRRHTTELSSNIRTANANVDERYAKYFGLNESYSSTTTLLKKTSSTVPPTATPSEALNAHVRLPQTVANGSGGLNQSVSLVQKRREMLKRTRAMSLETTGSCASSGSLSPTSMPSPKRALSPSRRSTTTSNNKLNIASFEDIVITADELHAAGHEFKRLCGEILGT